MSREIQVGHVRLSRLSTTPDHTKERWLLAGAEVMEREVKQRAQLLCKEAAKGLVVFLPHQSVREDTETLVHPQTCHGILGVVVVLVGTQQTLEHLEYMDTGI